jgi:hypothetical protein
MPTPILNTNTISVSAPASIATPAAGYVTYFFDTTNNNLLSYKDDAGNVYVSDNGVSGTSNEALNILQETACAWNKALLTGVVTPAEYGTILAAGLQVVTPTGTFQIQSVTP